jgi:hypothetical protein
MPKKSLQKKRKALKKKKAKARKNAQKDFKLGIKEERVKRGSANEAGLRATIQSNKRRKDYKTVRSI